MEFLVAESSVDLRRGYHISVPPLACGLSLIRYFIIEESVTTYANDRPDPLSKPVGTPVDALSEVSTAQIPAHLHLLTA